MPKRSYAFEPGGEKHLEISWRAFWKEVTISLDGNVLGVIPNQKSLYAGEEFRLIDGSTIKVQLVNSFHAGQLRVLRNGQPLPGSDFDPQARLKVAYQIVYFVAGINLILGLIALLYNSAFLQRVGFGFGSVLVGLVYFILGFFIWRRSSIALIVAIVLFIADGVLAFYFAVLRGSHLSGEGIMIRLAFLIPMFQGIGAIKTLKIQNR